jgi:hypothetical protein
MSSGHQQLDATTTSRCPSSPRATSWPRKRASRAEPFPPVRAPSSRLLPPDPSPLSDPHLLPTRLRIRSNFSATQTTPPRPSATTPASRRTNHKLSSPSSTSDPPHSTRPHLLPPTTLSQTVSRTTRNSVHHPRQPLLSPTHQPQTCTPPSPFPDPFLESKMRERGQGNRRVAA